MKSVSAKHVRNHYGLNLLDVAGFSVTYPSPCVRRLVHFFLWCMILLNLVVKFSLH